MRWTILDLKASVYSVIVRLLSASCYAAPDTARSGSIGVTTILTQGVLDDTDWTFQVFLTNRVEDANDIAWDYDQRAGIEAIIAELKGGWGIGHASSYGFAANHISSLGAAAGPGCQPVSAFGGYTAPLAPWLPNSTLSEMGWVPPAVSA